MSLFNTNKTRISYISTETGEKVYPVLVDVKKGVQGGESIQFVSSDINTGMLYVAFMLDNADYNVSGTEVICTIQRPDATILEIPCKHISNNVVEVYLGVNGTSQGGTYTFDFKVYKGGDKVVGTPILNYTVSQSISSDNSIEEDDRLPILNNLIIQVNDAIESIPSKEELKGEKGDKGDRGEQGVSIRSITEYYQVSTSNTVAPSSWLTIAPALTPTNKYLWNYRRIDYTDGNAIASDIRVIGVYGDSGITPNISIGNVTTLEPNQQATVTRRGTNENPIFDFGIPKGEKGDRGLQGEKGEKGDRGLQGEKGADGLTTAIKVNGTTYNHVNGTISLPNYPSTVGLATESFVKSEIANAQLGGGGDVDIDLSQYALKSELHNHENKSVLDSITSTKINQWDNKSNFSGNYNDLTNKPTIPTKVSQLTNDSNFLTSVPSGYVTESLLNSKGYLVAQDIANKADKTELHSHNNKSVLDGITSTKVSQWDSKSNFSGSYTDLTNKPTIPSKISELSNDRGYLTSIPSEYITETELNGKGYLTSVPSTYALKTDIPSTLPANGGNANTVGGYSIWVGTQSQYDSIASKSSTTIYMIKE